MNHHLRVALDQVSDAVLILQNGIGEVSGPVIVWGNASAVSAAGLPLAELAGASLQSLLTPASWLVLQGSLKTAFQGLPSRFPLRLKGPGAVSMEASAQATLGAAGEILSVILTFSPGSGGGKTGIPESGGAAVSKPGQPPSPEGWHGDVIETIRETARQVAHEFNNALTSIVLPVEMAIRTVPHSGDLFESLRVAHESAQRATDLAKDFLDCFRPRPAVRGLCASGELLGRAMRLATCAQNIGAVLDLAPGLEAIEVDESQLERVIFNLIRNSCQAMPNGGRLRVSADNFRVSEGDGVNLPPGPYVRIRVRDWGPGIPEEHRRHLFHSRFTTKPEGNGCGLPICYQIVRDHGGEMLVRSRVHVGTEFTILLPSAGSAEKAFKPAPNPLPALAVPRPVPNPGPVSGPPAEGELRTPPLRRSLLVVDDEPGVRQALSQMARSRGFEVSTAANSDEALQCYKDRLHAGKPYHSVLLDLNLRCGLNGVEVFEAIRRMDPEASVVATSGQHAEGDLERFQALGFAGFLAKPYSIERFDQAMRVPRME